MCIYDIFNTVGIFMKTSSMKIQQSCKVTSIEFLTLTSCHTANTVKEDLQSKKVLKNI